MTMTYHCQIQRANRVQHIIKDIGLGQIVREKYQRSAGDITAGKPGKYICITDTGITIVKAENHETVITMYVTTFRELINVYNGTKNIPSYLRKRVDHNQSCFTEKGKTIWK